MTTKTLAAKAGTIAMVLLATACGGGSENGGSGASSGTGGSGGGSGGSGGGTFTPATPPADVCSLLTLTDVQAVLPTASAGVIEPTADTPDIWNRICKWEGGAGSAESIELVVFGATTKDGLTGLQVMASGLGSTSTPVSGLGDSAAYWEEGTSDVGLVALQGSQAVDVTAYFFTQFPTADQLKPLVSKVLGEI